MGNQCTNLALLSNPCELKECVKVVTTRPRNSESRSIQWEVTLQPNTHYNGEPVDRVFLKLFVNSSSVTEPFVQSLAEGITKLYPGSRPNPTALQNNLVLLLSSLEYEMKINASLIQPAVRQHVCPFFPTVYSVGYNCTFTDLIDMFKTEAPSDVAAKLRTTPLQQQLNVRNISEAIVTDLYESLARSFGQVKTLAGRQGRSSKHAPPKPVSVSSTPNLEFIRQAKFCVMVSEVMQGKPLKDWCLENGIFHRGLNTDMYVLLFEVAYACYTLELAGVSHNDLHSGNVFVTTHPSAVPFYLCTSLTRPQYYRFTTALHAKVYDYDHASFPNYPNPMLEPLGLTRTYSHSQNVWPTKDFVKVIVDLAARCYRVQKQDRWFDEVLQLIVKSPDLVPFFRTLYEQGNSLQNPKKKSLTKKFFTDALLPMSDVLPRLAVKAGIPVTHEPAPLVEGEEFYAVDPSFFRDGNVQEAKVYNSLLTDEFYNRLTTKVELLQREEKNQSTEHQALQDSFNTKRQQLRNMEIEVRQQQYDVAQLQFLKSHPIF